MTKNKQKRIYINLLGLLLFPQVAFAASTAALGPVIAVLGVQLIVILATFVHSISLQGYKKKLILILSVLCTVIMVDLLPLILSDVHVSRFFDRVYLGSIALFPILALILAVRYVRNTE